MPGQIDNDLYNDLQNRLNDMVKGAQHSALNQFKIKADPAFPDRVTIQSRDKKKLSFNLSAEQGWSGQRVWMVGADTGKRQSVITPHIYGIYNEQSGDVSYQSHSSTQQLANIILQSFQETRGRGSVADVKSKFHQILSLGHSGLGIKPVPSVPAGWKGTGALSQNQIGFSVRSTGEGGYANPDQTEAVYKDFIQQYGNAFVPGATVRSMASASKADAATSFQDLNKYGYQFNDSGRLSPMYQRPNIVQGTGQWSSVKDPTRVIKSPSLTSGSEPVFPYRLDYQTGIPQQVIPGVTTNKNRPSYAISNVLMPHDEGQNRMYERRNVVYDVSPIPGAAIAYNDPQGVRADMWGKGSVVRSQVEGLNLNQLLSGEQRFEMDNFSKRTYGGGVPQASFGKFISPDGPEGGENIVARFGSSTWRPSGGGATLNLPAYVNPHTGKFGDQPLKGWDKTEDYRDRLMEKTGFKVNIMKGEKSSLSFGGVIEASSSIKGLDLKAEEVPVGVTQMLGKSNLPVSHLASDLKGSGFLYGFYGGLSYGQLSGLASDWTKANPELGGKIKDYLKTNFSEAAKEGRELNVDFDAMAASVGYKEGGQGLMVDWFNDTIRAAKRGSPQNRRNLQRYGAGWASGSVSLGMVHPDALEEMKHNWVTSHGDMKPEEAMKSFDKTFKAKMTDTGMYSVTQKLSQNAMYVSQLMARRSENIHGPRMGLDWLQGLNKRFPEVAEQMGLGLETFTPKGKSQTAAMGMLKYALWQGERQEAVARGMDPNQLNMPTNYKEVSDLQLSQMSAFLSGDSLVGRTAVDRIRGLADKFYGKESGINADDILFNKTAGYIPNPRALANATYSQLGVQSAQAARPAVELLSKLGNTVQSDMSEEMKQLEATNLQSGTLGYTKQLITGSGEFFKRLMGQVVETGVSGRTRANLMLGYGEAHIPRDRAEQVARQMGFKGGDVRRATRQIQETNAPIFDMRQPGQEADVNVFRNLPEKEYQARFGNDEAYQNIMDDPRFRGMLEVPYSWARLTAGDFDADPSSAAIGVVRRGNNIEAVESDKIQAALVNKQRIDDIEKRYFQDPTLRKMVNASASQLEDYANAKDVVGATLAQKKLYSPMDAIKGSVERLMNKTLGMGVGYNPRRAVVGGMSAQGYSSQEMSNVLSTIPGMYQPALDTLLKGPQAKGVPAASLIANPYFIKKDDDHILHLGKSGKRTRIQRTIEDAKTGKMITLPEETRPKYETSVNQLTSNRQTLFDATSFISEGFAEGYNIKGKNVGMSPKQFAGWFAAPGETDTLAGMLNPKDRASWSSQVTAYHSNMMDRIVQGGGSVRSGIEAVLATPAWMSIMTRATSKAMNKYDAVTGKEQIPGSMETLGAFMQNVSPAYQDALQTGTVVHDTEHRGKGMNLRGLSPSNIASAMRNMGSDIKGITMRAFGAALGVDPESGRRENYNSFSSQAGKTPDLPDVDEAFPPGEDYPPDPRDPKWDSILQGMVDKQTSAAAEGRTLTEKDYTQDELALIDRNNAPTANEGVRRRTNVRQRGNRLLQTAVRQESALKRGIRTRDEMWQPASGGAAPPSGGGGNRGGGTTTSGPSDSDDPSKPKRPSDVRQMEEQKRQGVAKRVGYAIRGIAGAVREYEHEPEMVAPYLDQLLAKSGYEGGSSPTELRERLETAFASDRKGLISKIKPSMMAQIKRLAPLQADMAYAQMFLDTAPGMAGDKERFSQILTKASDPRFGLGRDIESAAHVKKMFGDMIPNNPYMAQAAIELSGREDVQGLYSKLQPFMQEELTPERMRDVRKVLAETPGSMDNLRRAKANKEKASAIPSSISELRGFASKLEAVEPGIMKSRLSQTAEGEVERLSASFDKLRDATSKVNEVVEKRQKQDSKTLQQEEQKYRYEERKASAGYRSQLYRGLASEQEDIIGELSERMRLGGDVRSSKLTEDLAKAVKKKETFESQFAKAEQESFAIKEEEGGSRIGSFARRALSGFGLMYMRSIFNVATSGLGYGMGEREKYDAVQSQGMYASTGASYVPYNQQRNIENLRALYGVNYNPIGALSEFGARNPIARDIYNVGAAGVGSFSFAQWGMTSALGMSDKAAMKWSIPIGIGVAALSTAADTSARMKDPRGLGFRMAQSTGQGGGLPGFNDKLAEEWLNFTDKEGYQEYRQNFADARVMREVFEKGMSLKDMGNIKYTDMEGALAAQGVPTYKKQDGGKWNYAYAKDFMKESDVFAQGMNQMILKNPNMTQEAAAQSMSFWMRNQSMTTDDKRLQAVQQDYMMGGWAAQTAQAALGGLGYGPQMYGTKPGEDLDRLGSLQVRLASNEYNEEQRATLTRGIEGLGQVRGLSYVEGVGKNSKTEVTNEQIERFVEALGKIIDSSSGEVYLSQMAASDTSRRAGIAYQAPDIQSFVGRTMTPEQITRETSLAQAAEQQASTRIGYAQSVASSAYNIGDQKLGAGLYDMMMGTKPGQEWKMNRIMQGDPLMLANMATSGFNLNQLQGPVNVQGIQYSSSVLANTDISNEGRITGLSWGSTGLRRGSISAQQMGKNIFGDMQGIGVDAAVNGVQLAQPVTMWDGTQVSSVAGQMGLTVKQNQIEQEYQSKQFKFQTQGLQRDYDYQMKVWGIQDQQRALSYGHQMSSFGFQQESMGLQQRQMEMNNRFWQQGFSINMQQTQTQRGWQRDDWSRDAGVRAMQWGWQTEDFQEERRFMTGRSRRLAERDMERKTTMHNVDEDRIGRQQERQQELWRMEDERFKMQREQQGESVKLQKEQMELQRRQFEENKKYYLEAKKLEDEMIKIQRQHWLENHKASKEQLSASQKYQKEMLELRKTSDQMSIAFQLLQGAMNTFVDDSMQKFQQSLVANGAAINNWISSTSASASQLASNMASQIQLAGQQTMSGTNYLNPFSGGTGPSTTGGQNSVTLYNAPISQYGTLEGYTGTDTIFQGSLTIGGMAGGGDSNRSYQSVTMTGERGWEYMIDGQVIPHELSKELARRGVSPGSSSGMAKSALDAVKPQVFSPSYEPKSLVASKPTTIVVMIGNEELKRYVVDSVAEEF